MKRTAFGKAAICSLVVATTMVGCTGAAFRPSASVVPQKGNPAKFAIAAEKALADRDGQKAIEAAEAAVRLEPQNAAYRQVLGRAYVMAGRFASAETALSDAMALGSNDARTVVSLALVQVAQGHADAARSLLVSRADTVPASDYGLAMAMAGDAPEGVRILSEAIHDPSVNARTRQNLAYAYALAGRWKDARMIVGMDLDPLAANKRISDWAQIAEPSLAPQRVAALMGVTINAADAGLPVALALAPAPAGDPVQMAAAAPDAPVQTAMADVVPVATPEADSVVSAAAAPVRVAAYDFVADTRAAKVAAPMNRVAAPFTTPIIRMQKVAFIKPVATGASNWVVQLGAYDSAAVAKEKWMTMAGRSGTLAAFPVLTSQATVKGKFYHRLAISGFASRDNAMAACRTIRARNGQCFVRESSPDATPQRWAVALRGRQFAAR